MLQDPILLTFPVFLLIGALVFALRPRERAAQLLFLFGFAAFSDNFLTWSAVSPGVQDLFSAATYWPRIVLGNLTWTWLILPLLVHLFLAFPAEKGILRRFPRVFPLLLYGNCAVASLLYAGTSIGGMAVSSVAFATLVAVPCLLLSALGLTHSWLTTSDPVARLQARWIALGGLVGIVGPVGLWVAAGGLTPRSPFWVDLLYLLLALALPACLAIAILRYRLWDIEIIIRRTLVYSVVSGTLALVYYACVLTLQALFSALPGQPQTELVTVVSTLAAVALFFPLRGRVQRVVDRRFYRRKYDAARTLAAFSATARDQTDLQPLTAQLVEVVEETMQPASVSLWLRPGAPREETRLALPPVDSQPAATGSARH